MGKKWAFGAAKLEKFTNSARESNLGSLINETSALTIEHGRLYGYTDGEAVKI